MTKSTTIADAQRDNSVEYFDSAEYFEKALKMRDAMYPGDSTGSWIVGEAQDAKGDL